jgi:shikimate kinase
VLILLIGPKGSGKSHIGRTLEKRLGALFFHVEPLWMNYHAECRAEGRQPVIAEGITRVHPHIAEAMRTHEHVCVETTGASEEILNDLLRLKHPKGTLTVRVQVPLDLCLERIAARDPTHQIPMDAESIRKVYALSTAAAVRSDLIVENTDLTEDEIVSIFKSALKPKSFQGGDQYPTR